MIGAVFWNYLSIVFGFIAETVAWERWEGTLEYTFMAPIRRWVAAARARRLYAVLYGLVHTTVDARRAGPLLRPGPVAGRLR